MPNHVSDRAVRNVVKALLVSIAIVGMFYKFEVCLKDFYDYLGYSLPCVAGIVAGATVISESKVYERTFYLSSVVFLIFGFIFYIASHPSPKVMLLVFIMCLGFAALSGLGWFMVKKDYTGLGGEGFYTVMIILAMVIMLTIETGLIWKYFDDLKSSSENAECKCLSKADESIEPKPAGTVTSKKI